MTRDTVAVDTPAAAATVDTVARAEEEERMGIRPPPG
jgi:hypothetical protein